MDNYDYLDDLVYEIDYYNHRIATPNWNIEYAVIDFWDLTYVIDGKAEYTINGQKHIVGAGDLLCIPIGSQRSAVTFEDCPVESHCLNGILRTIYGEEASLPFPLIFRLGHQQDILALFHELKSIWLLRNPGYRLQVRAKALHILQRCIQLVVFNNNSNIKDVRIKKVMGYIIEHYREPITTAQMAELTGLSPMYFGSLFKQETGLSFKQYINSIRLNHAQDMLASGEFNVNETANACGFSDIFYFSKLFKEYHGVSPSKLFR